MHKFCLSDETVLFLSPSLTPRFFFILIVLSSPFPLIFLVLPAPSQYRIVATQMERCLSAPFISALLIHVTVNDGGHVDIQ